MLLACAYAGGWPERYRCHSVAVSDGAAEAFFVRAEFALQVHLARPRRLEQLDRAAGRIFDKDLVAALASATTRPISRRAMTTTVNRCE